MEQTKAFHTAIARMLHRTFNARGVDPQKVEELINVKIDDFLNERSDMSVVDFWRIVYSLRMHISLSPGELIFENFLPSLEQISQEDDTTPGEEVR